MVALDQLVGEPDTQLGAVFPNPINPPSGCHFHPRCPRAIDICSTKAPVATLHQGKRVECHLVEGAVQ